MKKIFIGILIFRLIISFLPPMSIDMGAWQAWAMRIVEVGPQNFYSTKIFTDNPPGYLYIFWVIGAVREYLINWSNLTNWLNGGGFAWLLKLPGNLFDLGTGLLIYKIISHKRGGLSCVLGVWGFLLYTLNPAVWFNSAVFGQFDGAGAFFGLLAVYLLLEKKRLGFSAAALAIAWAVKPQAIALAPAVGILALYSSNEVRSLKKLVLGFASNNILKLALCFIGTTLLLYWPFFPNNPLAGMFYIFSRMNNIYSCTTCYAFNFWGIFGNWLDDRVLFLGLPLLIWGIILGGLGMLGILIFVGAHHDAPASIHNTGRIYLAISLSVMAFFMFVTRMHERYLLPFFAFFLISVILSKSKFLMLCYLVISGLSLLNVYYPYANYNTDLHLTPGLVLWLGENFRLLSMVGFGSFLLLLYWYFFNRYDVSKTVIQSNSKTVIGKAVTVLPSTVLPFHRFTVSPKQLSWSRKEIIMVFLLVFVSFLIRVIRLDIPKTYYFDEVYHAFTAVEMEKGNKAAWEWWNTPPAGFAYEWTHPPLAKELMVLGIRGIRVIREIGVFGDFGGQGNDAVGWRLPGVIMGTGVIFLIYLLGKQLFNIRVGLISAFLASMDGLLFTQSRIGMNDIYFLFFMMLAFYLFVKGSLNDSHVRTRKGILWRVLMGVSLGLALASKWTALYGIGILGGLYFIRRVAEVANEIFSGTKPAAAGVASLLSFLKNLLSPRNLLRFLSIFLIIPVLVYLLTYIPFFASGHTWQQFDELQHQMWWYHTGLKATHPYTSPWYSWPFLQRPVWYYVDYGISQISPIGQIGGPTIANLYAMGNPMVWWAGIAGIAWIIIILLRRLAEVAHAIFSGTKPCGESPRLNRGSFRSSKIDDLPANLFIVLLGYFGFFLPWALSPRIMFLYHYLPSLPFLFLALGYGQEKISQIGLIGQMGRIQITGKMLTTLYLILATLAFVYFYPQLSALPVSKEWSEQYFWFASWR